MNNYRHTLKSNYLYYYFIAGFILIIALHLYLLLILLCGYLIYFKKRYHHKTMFCFLLIIATLFIYTKKQVTPKTISGNYTVVNVKAYEYNNQVTIRNKTRKYILYTNEDYKVGSILDVSGKISEFNYFYTPGSFNFKEYYRSVGISGLVNDYQISETNQVNYLYSGFNLISDPHLKVFLTNDTLNENLEASLRTLNIYYLISLSGIHIYFLISILKKLMFEFNIKPKNQNIVTISLVLLMVYLSGFSVTMLRILIYQVLRSLKRKYYPNITNYELMNIAFLCLIFMRPYLMFNLSFLISYLIVTGFHLFRPLILSNSLIIRQIKISFLVNVIIIAFYQTINVTTILLSPIYYLIIINLVFPISLLNNFLGLEVLTSLNQKILALVAANNSYNIIVNLKYLKGYLIVIYFVLIIGIVTLKNKHKIVCLLLLLLTVISPSFKKYYSDDRLYFLDVGQGDSIVYISSNLVIVIDAYQNVSNFLKYEGISKIDYLILSHSDNDHMREANDLINNFKVENIIISNFDEYELNSHNLTKVNAGLTLIEDNVMLTFFGPLRDYGNANDNSLVFKFENSDYSVLFTGDISVSNELELISNYGQLLKSDILKVAHHGSQTSTSIEFLKYVSPRHAIISLGRNNSYGFPSNEVINNLNTLNINILRTDLDGTIMIDENLDIKTYHNYSLSSRKKLLNIV